MSDPDRSHDQNGAKMLNQRGIHLGKGSIINSTNLSKHEDNDAWTTVTNKRKDLTQKTILDLKSNRSLVVIG